ncbi:MAG TPA: PIN domain-containing protein [Bryobacteraceae bacterium]|nr:PIN domain-containing protein [Bryobacteraceae bacterium]
MTYLLDTNAFSDVMKAHRGMEIWLRSVGSADRVATCTIVRGEVLFGVGRLAEGKRRSALEEKARELFEMVPCEPVPERAGDAYATIKLARQVTGLGA